MFITHARTLEELRAEFLSDLLRRIQSLDTQARTVGRSVAEKSRLACAAAELEQTHKFWTEVKLASSKQKSQMTVNEARTKSNLPPIEDFLAPPSGIECLSTDRGCDTREMCSEFETCKLRKRLDEGISFEYGNKTYSREFPNGIARLQ